MTIWVDDMYKSSMGRFRRMKMSHLIGSSEPELHEMVKRIGVARRWYQGDHYDICMSKRALAISYGAIPITMYELAAVRWCLERGKKFTSLQHAREQMLRRIKSLKGEQRGRA